MKDKTFFYIWEEIIKKQIEQIYASFTEEEKDKYNFEIKDLNQYKKLILKSYNEARNRLKSHYYDNKNKGKNPLNRIDNHKIASCICYSLTQNKVFDFTVVDNMPQKMFLANYELAYSVSLAFVFSTLVAQYKFIGEDKFADKLLLQKTFFVPETSKGHDKYHEGRIKTIALNDLYGNTFDILSYADMMFWIEHYNRQLLENTLYPRILSKEKPEI